MRSDVMPLKDRKCIVPVLLGALIEAFLGSFLRVFGSEFFLVFASARNVKRWTVGELAFAFGPGSTGWSADGVWKRREVGLGLWRPWKYNTARAKAITDKLWYIFHCDATHPA